MFRLTHYVAGLSVILKSFSLNHNQGGEGIRKSIFTLKTPIKYVGEDRAAREDEKKNCRIKDIFHTTNASQHILYHIIQYSVIYLLTTKGKFQV